MQNFFRAVKIGLHYRFTVLGIIACSLLVAAFWGANIGTIYPMVEVVFEGKSVPEYLEQEVRTLDTAIAEKKILVAQWKTA
ncbi:MAG: ABC transporter ATP-binding protein, partial [Planctomycetota bacterium]|nr:ABC transporter ATP-binding protein [Planctomycetota bacterium]